MTTEHSPLISLQSISKTYGEDPLDYQQMVLKNIHIEVKEGEFLLLFGPSGSGKSTVLYIMAGLEKPTGGAVYIRRRNLANFNSEELAQYHRLKMGLVFQSYNLIKSLNVWENVALPQTALGVRYGLRRKRALHMLKLLGIDQYANRHPNEVSGGEQQRVAIARAMMNNPLFLLLDEPTGNLDSKSGQEVMRLLHDLHRHSKHTIIMVTHNPEHLPYATRIIHLRDGQVVGEEKQQHNEKAIHDLSSANNQDGSTKTIKEKQL